MKALVIAEHSEAARELGSRAPALLPTRWRS